MDPTNSDSPTTVGGISRRQQIVRLLLRYRHSGVFSGISLDGEIPRLGKPPATGHCTCSAGKADIFTWSNSARHSSTPSSPTRP